MQLLFTVQLMLYLSAEAKLRYPLLVVEQRLRHSHSNHIIAAAGGLIVAFV